MCVVDNTVIILVFVVIITIAGVSAWIIEPGNYDNTRWKVFLTTAAALGIVMLFAANYANLESKDQQERLLVIKESQHIEEGINGVTRIMSEGVDVLPSFIRELMPLQYPTHHSNKQEETLQQTVYKYQLSKTIFSLWQLVVVEREFVKDEDGAYMSLFLQWARSKQLKEAWRTSRMTLSSHGKRFGDLLFEYSHQVRSNTTDEYERVAKLMVCSSEYKELF